VLSSGVAGTMAANRSGLQMATLRNLLLAWVLTLPICVLLGGAIFAAALNVIFHQLWWPLAGGTLLVLAVVTVLFARRKGGGKSPTEMAPATSA
jgi:hypothetical protein